MLLQEQVEYWKARAEKAEALLNNRPTLIDIVEKPQQVKDSERQAKANLRKARAALKNGTLSIQRRYPDEIKLLQDRPQRRQQNQSTRKLARQYAAARVRQDRRERAGGRGRG